MLMRILVECVCTFVAIHVFADSQSVDKYRRFGTPKGWRDDMGAAMSIAGKEKKDLLVYVPLSHDVAWGGDGKKFSPLKSWTNPQTTAKLAESYVLVFCPWEYMSVISPEWKKVREYSRGITPSLLIVKNDGTLVWVGYGPAVLNDGENSGDEFAAKRLPKLQKVLKPYFDIKKRIEDSTDESQAAKQLYEVFKNLDYGFVSVYFRDDIQYMVNADKAGALGIRERYPFFWLVSPLSNMLWKFYGERNERILKIQKQAKLSRKEAGLLATREMKNQWQDRFKKLMRVAEKAEPKLFDDGDRICLERIRKEAEAHLKIWSGESKEIPGL